MIKIKTLEGLPSIAWRGAKVVHSGDDYLVVVYDSSKCYGDTFYFIFNSEFWLSHSNFFMKVSADFVDQTFDNKGISIAHFEVMR